MNMITKRISKEVAHLSIFFVFYSSNIHSAFFYVILSIPQENRYIKRGSYIKKKNNLANKAYSLQEFLSQRKHLIKYISRRLSNPPSGQIQRALPCSRYPWHVIGLMIFLGIRICQLAKNIPKVQN